MQDWSHPEKRNGDHSDYARRGAVETLKVRGKQTEGVERMREERLRNDRLKLMRLGII